MKKLLVAALLLLFPFSVIAGSGSGLVKMLYVHEKNISYNAPQDVVMFELDGVHLDAACPNVQWAFSIETDMGRSMFALLLSAAAQKQKVAVEGTGDCTAWKDRERPKYIVVTY